MVKAENLTSDLSLLRYMCTICSTLIRSTNVETHLKIHLRGLHCELCNSTHRNDESLVHHINDHLDKWFECPICSDIFSTKDAYMEHSITHGRSLFAQKVHYECCECEQIYYIGNRNLEGLADAMKKHQEMHGLTKNEITNEAVELPEVLSEDEGSNETEIIDCSHTMTHLDQDIDESQNETSQDENVCISTTRTVTKNVKKGISHQCHVCKESFNAKLVLRNHLKTMHKKDIEKQCTHCSKLFISNKRLLSHVKSHVAKSKKTSGKHLCGVCKMGFTTLNALTIHQKNTHKDLVTEHRCLFCTRPTFKSRNYLMAHIKRSHNSEWDKLQNTERTLVGTHHTPESNSNDEQKSNLDAILEMAVTGKKKKNEESYNNNSDNPEMVIQNDIASDDESGSDSPSPFPCNSCQKTYQSKSGLIYHITAAHSKNSKELCSLCGDSFKTKVQYRNHMKKHASDYECSTCNLRFYTAKKLNKHMNQNACHVCEVCGQRFHQRYNLVLHRSIHTGEKPFQCYECGKMFRIKSYLEDHLRVHRGERQFVCMVCGMKFIAVGALRRHASSHSEERPFMCSQCGKGFKLHANLNRHMRIHSGETYDCPICHRKITEKSNLAKHMRIHEKHGQMSLSASLESLTEENTQFIPMNTTTKAEEPQQESVCVSVQLQEHTEPVVLTIPVRSSL